MEIALLDGRATLEADRARVSADTAGDLLTSLGTDAATAGRVAGRGRCEVGDVFRDWVAGADIGDAYVGGFAGFAEGVVARVKVFAFLWGSVSGMP